MALSLKTLTEELKKRFNTFSQNTIPQTAARIASGPTINRVAQHISNLQPITNTLSNIGKVPLQAKVGQLMQKFPDTGVSPPKGIGVTNLIPTKAQKFINAIPGEYIRSMGRTLERSWNPKQAISNYKNKPLGTALEDVGNLTDLTPLAAGIPLLASVAKTKFNAAKVLSKADDIKRVVNLEKELDFIQPSTQMEAFNQTKKLIDEFIPEFNKSKEVKKLGFREYIKTANTYLNDLLLKAKNPEINFGFSTQAIRRTPTQATKGVVANGGLYDVNALRRILSRNADKMTPQDANRLSNIVYGLRNYEGDVSNLLKPNEKAFLDNILNNPNLTQMSVGINKTIDLISNKSLGKGVIGTGEIKPQTINIGNKVGVTKTGVGTGINLGEHNASLSQMGKKIFAGDTLGLSKEEYVKRGIEYYKTTPEYLNAGEDKGWFETTTKNTLLDYYNQAIKDVAQQPLNEVKANVGGQITKTGPSFPVQTKTNKPIVSQISDSSLAQKPLQKQQTQTSVLEQPKTQPQSPDSNLRAYKFNVLDRLYTEFVNRFHPLSKLAKAGGKDAQLNRKIAGFYGSGSTADYHLNYELSPILKGGDLNDIKQASIAMRDVELLNRGIKGSPEQANATKILENLKSKYGEDGMKQLGETLQKLYKYQDDMAQRYLVDTGIMSKSAYEKMRADNSFYIPFKRVSDKMDEFLGIPVKHGAGSVGSQNVIFKIKGSDKELIDPIESIVENTYKMVSLGRRQELAQTVAGLSKEFPELVQRTNLSGIKDTISLFENGKKVNYLVPEEVADAARGMSEESLVMLAKILKVPTDIFRTMTTGVNPEFLLPNISRDVQSALFNTGLNPLKWVAGLYHYAKQDAVYKDFLKAGGKSSRVSINRPFLKQTAEEVAGKGFKIKSPKDIIRGLEMLSQYSEQPTRVAVFKDAYKKAIKNGLSEEDALSEAAYWAQEGTVNFARRGSKMPNINAIYAYLNARIQGVDRMLRTAKNNPGKAALRFGIGFLGPSIALYAWNSNNPDYYNDRIVSKRDKQDNFIFMLPKPVGEVRYLKIPKSEIGKVVNPVEASLDWAKGRGGNVWQSIGSVLKSFSPIDNWGGVIPTAINPLVENAFNKDFYSGYDLVPEYKKNYPKAYQDSPYTGPLYRFAGQKLNISPAKLQNLAEGYGGGMMRVVDYAAGKLLPDQYTSAKNEQGASVNRLPVVRRFMGGEKKTEDEQIKSNISRSKALEFDVNDIKSGIKKGDIPLEIGQAQIDKIRQEQAKLTSVGSASSKGVGSKLYMVDGELKEIDASWMPEAPTLTGSTELDKKAISKFNGELTQKANDIYDLYKAGVYTQDEAEKQLTELKSLKIKSKKPKKVTFKVTKYKAPKITLKKSSLKKLPTIKFKKLKTQKLSRKYTIKG